MPRKVTKEVRSDNQSSRDGSDDDTQYGGSYKHVDEHDMSYNTISWATGLHSIYNIHSVICLVMVVFVPLNLPDC